MRSTSGRENAVARTYSSTVLCMPRQQQSMVKTRSCVPVTATHTCCRISWNHIRSHDQSRTYLFHHRYHREVACRSVFAERRWNAWRLGRVCLVQSLYESLSSKLTDQTHFTNRLLLSIHLERPYHTLTTSTLAFARRHRFDEVPGLRVHEV